MINSVNLGNLNNSYELSANKAGNNLHCKNTHNQNVAFKGYEDDYQSHPIRNLFLSLTGDAVGLVGFNAALWWVQDFVNGKLLVGKINKHFTKNIQDKEKLFNLANDMVKEEQKNKRLGALEFHQGQQGQAYYTNIGNKVVVGDTEYSALFHEIGHAVEENGTKIFKFLQNHRGNYTVLSLALYALLSQRKNNQNNEHKSFISKLLSPNVLVPMLAFSPELITEAKASKVGLDFLEKKLKNKEIDENLFKNIKRSYLTCFATYLFIPVSIILMEKMQHSAEQAINRRKERAYY